MLSVLSGCWRTSAAVRVHSARIDDGWRADRRARMRVGVRAIEPGATVAPPSTLADRLDTQLATRRVTADVVTILAVASLALIAGRLLESVLIGVTSRDPLTLTLVPATCSPRPCSRGCCRRCGPPAWIRPSHCGVIDSTQRPIRSAITACLYSKTCRRRVARKHRWGLKSLVLY